MSVNTYFDDMKGYFGNCGMSVTGYDVYEIERTISGDLHDYFVQYKKENPEPDDNNYNDLSDFYRDHDAWESDASTELNNYFEAKIGDEWIDVLESNYHPVEFLAEYFGIKKEEVVNIVGNKQLAPEDLDAIVDEDCYYYHEPDEAIDHIRSAIAKL